MRKVNFHTLDNLTVPEQLIEKALAIPNTEKPRRRIISGRTAIAAAIIALFIGVFTIYGIYIMPTATVFMESRESVVLTLNSRGNVLSATDHPELGGQSAEEAVRAVAKDMIESGALSAEENTLLLGTQNLSDEARAQLTQTVQDVFAESRFHGAIVSLPCSEKGAKAAVIDRLMQSDDSLSRERLKELGVNELNLLLHEVKTDGILLIGDPTESSEPHRIADVRKPDGDKPPNEPQTAIPPDTTVGELPSSDVGDLRQPELIQTVPDATQTATGNADPTEAPVTPTSQEKATAPSEIDARPAPTQMPTQEPTSAPTQEPTSAPTKKATSAPTQEPTSSPTETPTETVRFDSLIYTIKYIDQLSNGSGERISYGQGIPFTPITPSYQWRMNYLTVHPAVTHKAMVKMGEQDKHIAVFRSYADYVNYNTEYISNETANKAALSEYIQKMRSDHKIDEDFFRDNALIMIYYSDFAIYNGEEDSIVAIETDDKGDAYITMMRTCHGETGLECEEDFFKSVVAAKVKKSDIENINKLYLTIYKKLIK